MLNLSKRRKVILTKLNAPIRPSSTLDVWRTLAKALFNPPTHSNAQECGLEVATIFEMRDPHYQLRFSAYESQQSRLRSSSLEVPQDGIRREGRRGRGVGQN
jgi:hypothetical protein